MIRRYNRIYNRRSSGSSLLLVVIGMSAASLVAYYASQAFLNQNRAFAHYTLMGEVEDLNLYFARAIDCDKTFDAPTLAICSSTVGGAIAIKVKPLLLRGSATSTTLISGTETGSRILPSSSFKVRSSCKLVGTVKTWKVEFNRINAENTRPLLDPVTHLLFNGAPLSPYFKSGDPIPGWKSVIQGVNLCAANLL